MHAGISLQGRILPTGKPGRRFRDRYHRQQRSGQSHGPGPRVARIILAVLAAAIGVVLIFIPGPAVVFFLFAGALLATDWLPVARLLDWGETHARRIGTRVRRLWEKLSWAGRVAVVAAGAGLSAAVSFGFYRLLQ